MVGNGVKLDDWIENRVLDIRYWAVDKRVNACFRDNLQ